MTSPASSVIIVGAGVAGLSCAWWLSRAGWKVTLVERADNLRGGAYMMGLSGPGYAAAKRMGLLPALEPCGCAVNENVYRSSSGRELLRLRYREFLRDMPYIALLRTDLVRVLDEAVGPGPERRMGVTVTAIDQRHDGVSAVLSDGTRLEADLLIGADGFRSGVRRLVFGEDTPFLQPLGYRFAVYDADRPRALEADFVSYVEPGHMAEYYRVAGERMAALHVWRSQDTNLIPQEQRWDELAKMAANSNPFVKDTLRSSRDGPAPVIDTLSMIDMPAWSKGRVLLLGDSAHCLTLISGQGAGMAMTSAEILAQELAAGPIDAAIAAHAARLRPAIERLQQRSRRMGPVFVPATPFAFAMRNIVLRYMPRAWLGKYFLNAVKAEIALTGDAPRAG